MRASTSASGARGRSKAPSCTGPRSKTSECRSGHRHHRPPSRPRLRRRSGVLPAEPFRPVQSPRPARLVPRAPAPRGRAPAGKAPASAANVVAGGAVDAAVSPQPASWVPPPAHSRGRHCRPPAARQIVQPAQNPPRRRTRGWHPTFPDRAGPTTSSEARDRRPAIRSGD